MKNETNQKKENNMNEVKKKPSLALWIIVGAIALLVASKLVTIAFGLISAQDDLAVAGGVVIIVLMAALIAWLAPKVVRRARAFRNVLVMVAMSMMLTGCGGCTRVGAGYAGIKINNYGTNRGVQDIPLVTGWVYYNPWTQSVFEYPCFVQTAVWDKEEQLSFNLSGGVIGRADISLSYQFIYEKVPAFYVKFRSDDISNFTHGFLRNVARDSFNEVAPYYTVEDMYSSKKEEMMKTVKDRVNGILNPMGAHIEQFGFLHALVLPPEITNMMNAKAQAIQQAIMVENQLRATQAEAMKVVAKAKGAADANQLITKSITPELLQWRSMDIQQQAIEKWNGVRPSVEAGSQSGLLLQIAPKP